MENKTITERLKINSISIVDDDESNNTKTDNGILKKLQGKFSMHKENANAYESYLLATYGTVESKEKRLETFYENINTLIRSKAQSGQYCCAAEIPSELVTEYLDKIIKTYETLGYSIIYINDKYENFKRNYIFITWDNKF